MREDQTDAMAVDGRFADVVPRALALAARVYAKNPKKLGEIVLALVGGADAPRGLDEGQAVTLALCREELDKAADRRGRARERKAKWRAGRRADQPTLGI